MTRTHIALCVAVSLTVCAGTARATEIAYDGTGNMLVVGRSGGQIVGQILSKTGAPISPRRTYTSSPNRKFGTFVRYGGGRYLVAYTNVYQDASDFDIEGLVIRTDGTLETAFHIDFSSLRDTTSGLVYVAERSQFYVLYTRDFPTPSTAPTELRGVYVSTSGSTSGRSILTTGHLDSTMGSNALAYGPGNILVVFRDTNTVWRGHFAPGETAFRERIWVANVPLDFSHVFRSFDMRAAYHADLSRFAVTYSEHIYRDSTRTDTNSTIYAQTIPVGCLTSNCAGTSTVKAVLSTSEAGTRIISGHALAPAGNNFVVTAGTLWSDRTGVLSAAFDGTAFAHTKHLGPWASTCSTQGSYGVEDAASLGSEAVYLMRPPCSSSPAFEGLTLNTWSGRTATPFAVTGMDR